jgi:hypothetical protein
MLERAQTALARYGHGVVWWVVAGVLVLAILVLVVALTSLAGRVRPLSRAQRRLRLRAEQVEKLQAKVLAVEEHAAVLQSRIQETAMRAEHLRPPGVGTRHTHVD